MAKFERLRYTIKECQDFPKGNLFGTLVYTAGDLLRDEDPVARVYRMASRE